MRLLIMVTGCLIACSIYALKTIAVKEPLIEMSPYIVSESIEVQDDFLSEENYSFNALSLPVKSRLSPGDVKKNTTDKTFPYCFFVIGDDAFSKRWFLENSLKLKSLHAVGFVTEVKTLQAFKALENLSDIPLIAMKMDETASFFGVRHYPFAFCEGELWQ